MSSSRHLRYKLHVALFGHIGNWLWRSRLRRRQVRGQATREAANRFLQPYADAARTVPEDVPAHAEPRRVFSLWLQGTEQAPPLIKACIDSIRRNCGAELVVLDGKTVFDWITLPDYIVRKWKEGKIKAAHFSDICRVELLYRHGGVWMDATDYLDAPLPEWLWEADFFVYQGGETLKGAYGGIQNCFIRGAKDAYLLKVWREAIFAYWAAENTHVDYFVHQMLFCQAVAANPRATELYEKMPHLGQDPTHVLWYEYADQPYDEARFHAICAEALFQKTSYKCESAVNPVPGSFADHLLAPYRPKRLFLFAFYDPKGVVGESALRYLEALHDLGDIVLATDCDLQPGEADKLAPLVLSFMASRHEEYDFGSYKRAYLQADLSGYDVVYLVNDSVVGPLYPLEPYLRKMEMLGTDAFSLVLNPSRTNRHLQSWFIGLRPSVFQAPWFREFMESVTAVESKGEVCSRYESGLARLLEAHSVPYAGLYELKGKAVYNDIRRLSAKKFPFIKKSAFTRHGGCLGPSVGKALKKADPAMASAVIADMDRLYGEDYRRKFLSASRLQAFGRYLRYLSGKVTGR